MDVLFNVVGILTATLVVTVAHFPLETTRSLLSFGSAPVVRYIHRQKALTVASEHARMRALLGQFIDEGRLMLARLRDPARDAESSRLHVHGWTTQVEEFLRNDLGSSYVARLHSTSFVDDGEIEGIPLERLQDWRNLCGRVCYLELLRAEI